MCHSRVIDAHLGPGMSDIGIKKSRHIKMDKRPIITETAMAGADIRSEAATGFIKSNMVVYWQQEQLSR